MKIDVSKNWEIKFDKLFLNQSALAPNLLRIFIKTDTSKNSAKIKAIKLAAEILADMVKIKSYAVSCCKNLVEGGRLVANRLKIRIKNMTNSPDLIILLVLSAPYTSVIISLMEKVIGTTKIATLAFNLKAPESIKENVFAPINSATQIQKI